MLDFGLIDQTPFLSCSKKKDVELKAFKMDRFYFLKTTVKCGVHTTQIIDSYIWNSPT